MGACRTGAEALVSSYGAHFGEEPPLVGQAGSGTIFFAACNLACIFCQNYDISHLQQGRIASAEGISGLMIHLQRSGCHNINLVTPTHVLVPILEAVRLAAQDGLRVPIVYNCGGYESVDSLRLLEGIVDIYMPDFKYCDAEMGQLLSGVPDYPAVAMSALREMHRQVGDLELDPGGLATRGLIIRHLVLPENMAGTHEVLKFITEEISLQTYVNIMAQYHPAYRSHIVDGLERRITRAEYNEAVESARMAGLTRLARQ